MAVALDRPPAHSGEASEPPIVMALPVASPSYPLGTNFAPTSTANGRASVFAPGAGHTALGGGGPESGVAGGAASTLLVPLSSSGAGALSAAGGAAASCAVDASAAKPWGAPLFAHPQETSVAMTTNGIRFMV